MSTLFENKNAAPEKSNSEYTADDIEVLQGLEPVRRRPGMYIGGTDEKAMHHLVGEILDNAMDEAVAGYANRIEVWIEPGNIITIEDNGRGIPVDRHPKFPEKSALEVIVTTLHAGGKFGGKAYKTSGGLHGVGISVVNALSDMMEVEVAREKTLYRQSYAKGKPLNSLENAGPVHNRRGTKVRFRPDPEIFGINTSFRPQWLYKMMQSKAYLFRGVEIRWHCAPSIAEALLKDGKTLETEKIFHYPNGLLDFLNHSIEGKERLTSDAFSGRASFQEGGGFIEYAVTWLNNRDGFMYSYCNTIPTPQGGTHENGLRSALSRSLKNYGEMINNKKAAAITAEDVMVNICAMISVFIQEPQFQGQTKEKLANGEVSRLVDGVIRDRFDLWLSEDQERARTLLENVIEQSEIRQRRREERELQRKTATRKTRLPGKLADCSRSSALDTEIFLVEGDSAGGSAKQARNRETQAILPLRGKILNVASATRDKIRANQEIQDIIQALGCGIGKDCDPEKLRYDRVIIMTDADVDGAHIASLLITFFYSEMRPLIEQGYVYIAQPPLYRLTSGNHSAYAMDEAHKDRLYETEFKNKKKVDVSRFKGLGEMPAAQLKETTMHPDSRKLLRITIPEAKSGFVLASAISGSPLESLENGGEDAGKALEIFVEGLMGRSPETRFKFIQENAAFVDVIDV